MTTKPDPSQTPVLVDDKAFAEAAEAQATAVPTEQDPQLAEKIAASIDLAFGKAAGQKVH